MPAVRKLISLGEACEVAYQLRQHSGDDTAHFFDWLVTPADGLLHIIRNGFPKFAPENLSLQRGDSRTGFVLDAVSRVMFPHQFPRHGRLIAPDFLSHYPSFAAKFDYLANRFRNTARDHPVCFVRRNLTQPQALDLEDAMYALLPQADMRFLYVNADRTAFTTPLGHSVYLPRATRGFGDSIAWSKLLRAEGLVGAPFRLATAEILRANIGDNHLSEVDRHPASVLIKAMRSNPNNPWFAHELGMWALKRRRFWLASVLAKRALKCEPGNPEFTELYLRGRVGARRMPRETALARTLTLLPHSSGAGPWAFAADLQIALGRCGDSLQLLAKRLEQDPHDDRLHALRARALLAAGRGSEAESAIDRALALHLHSRAHIALKARVLSSLGRPDEALRLVEASLRHKQSLQLRLLKARIVISQFWRATRIGKGHGRFA